MCGLSPAAAAYVGDYYYDHYASKWLLAISDECEMNLNKGSSPWSDAATGDEAAAGSTGC